MNRFEILRRGWWRGIFGKGQYFSISNMVVHVHSIYRFILFQKPILRIGGKLSRIYFKLNSAKGRWRKCPFLKLLQCYCLSRIFLYNNSKLGLIIVFCKGGLISEGIFLRFVSFVQYFCLLVFGILVTLVALFLSVFSVLPILPCKI